MIKKEPDVAKWIRSSSLNVNELKEVVQDEKDSILKNLLENYIYTQTSSLLTVPYSRIIGPVSLTYLKSQQYNKYIILLGDLHGSMNFEIFKKINGTIRIDDWIKLVLRNNTKLIDIYVEIDDKFTVNVDDTRPLNCFQKTLEACFREKQCSARVHYTDIRREKDLSILTSLLSKFYLKTYSDMDVTHIIDTLKSVDIFIILKNLGIHESFLGIDTKSIRNVSLIIDTFRIDLNKGILMLIDFLNIFMDMYTVSRMFRKSSNIGYDPDPTFIICYQGRKHTDSIKQYLVDNLNFQQILNVDNENVRMVNITNLPNPIFSDI